MLLLAARAYLNARRPDDAERVLAAIAAPTTPEQNFERQMLGVELALAREQGPQAWQQLSAIPEPDGRAGRVALSRAEAARGVRDRPRRGSRARGNFARAFPAQRRRAQCCARRSAARACATRASAACASSRAARRIRSFAAGWSWRASPAASARSPTTATPDVEAWRTRYPNHPANDAVRSELLGLRPEAVERVAHVALLLPLSGPAGQLPRPPCAMDS